MSVVMTVARAEYLGARAPSCGLGAARELSGRLTQFDFQPPPTPALHRPAPALDTPSTCWASLCACPSCALHLGAG